jgi:aldose 1-epimerase
MRRALESLRSLHTLPPLSGAAMQAVTTPFGALPSGRAAHAITLSNPAGMSVCLTTFGATVLSVKVPSSAGGAEEVTLCHTNLQELSTASPYFGATVGRVANRTAKGRFEVDGKAYACAVNNGPNHLHGGLVGFDKVIWQSRVVVNSGEAAVEFSYTSPAGEEGYPGTLQATATYSLTASNELKMDFTATSDAATPVNLCNHTYWNLSGNCRTKILDHLLTLHMPFYTPTDATQIPTGEILPVAGTIFDFTKATRIGERIDRVDGGGAAGYDHNYARALDAGFTHGLSTIALLEDPASGRKMKVETNAPGVQFYTGNWLDAKARADPHRALCLEVSGPRIGSLKAAQMILTSPLTPQTQNYPDAVNKAGKFPSAILRPGEVYSHKVIHSFTW